MSDTPELKPFTVISGFAETYTAGLLNAPVNSTYPMTNQHITNARLDEIERRILAMEARK